MNRGYWHILLSLGALAGCAPSAHRVESQASPMRAGGRPDAAEPLPDVLLVTPPAFAEAVKPWVAHRETEGHRVRVLSHAFANAAELREAIVDEHTRGNRALRFVLLMGDAAPEDEPQANRLPTFYLKKLNYNSSHALYRYHAKYPSDGPYAEIDGAITLAVGRVPARTVDEVSGFVKKVIRYETEPVTKAWPRRVVLRAGTAGFGAFTDAAIETTALGLLNDGVPYDFDLSVTFGKESSSYASRPDQLGEQLVEEANEGALFFTYVGHSGKSQLQSMDFRGLRYSHGDRDDFARMRIPEGAPLFVSLSCDAGAYDMPYGDKSISEEAVLNPTGPIAAFAASRVSHPYPNLLYGEAFIENFLTTRPDTLGEGIVQLKNDMLDGFDILGEVLTDTDTSRLKHEHVGLYNLLGDPATRLRYPDPVDMKVLGEPTRGRPLSVTIQAAISAGTAVVTLETKRNVIHHELDEVGDGASFEVFEKLAKNHRRANDKRLSTQSHAFDGSVTVELPLPSEAGRYVVKAFVRSNDGKRFGAGHTFVDIRD